MTVARPWCFAVCSLVACVLATAAAAVSAEQDFTPVASGVRYRKIGSYDKARLAEILDRGLDTFMGGFDPSQGSTMKSTDFKAKFAAPRNGVTLYEVQFDSVIPEWDNQPTTGSGLLAIPEDDSKTHPLVSYQHGTVFGRDQVPSRPDDSYETQLALAAFAGQGYVVIGADYFGLGASRVPNCFIVARGTTQSMLDHYRASQAVLDALGQSTPQFFVWGWSQGGWSTMQFLRRLETLGIPVTAAATVSAPVDLAAAFRRPIANPRPQDAAWIKGCISNMLWSQEEYARLPGLAASAIKPEHLAASRKFFNGELSWPEYDASVPGGVTGLLQPAFIAGAETGRGRFWDLLEEAGAYRWKIKTPLRAYGGDADEAIPPAVSRMVFDFATMLGSPQVEFFSAGERADHRASYVSATLAVKPWFDGFVKPATKDSSGR
ncbi:MAG: alpha/beta hydrolase [Planctomycetes bacterium]|nr:alpha/beta hydrolase [Planctomycetota bacterium]